MGVVQLQDDPTINHSQRQLSTSNNTDPPLPYGPHDRGREQPSTSARSNENLPSQTLSSQPQTHRNLTNIRALNQPRPRTSSQNSNDRHSRNSRGNNRGNTSDTEL